MGRRLDTYLRKLPGELDAHPGAMMKASLVRNALASRRLDEAVVRDAPLALAQTLRDPPPASAWIPVTHVIGTLLLIADQYELDDVAFITWRREQYRGLLGGPLYRMLFAFVSPEKLVAGAAYKWKSLTKDSLVLDSVETATGAGEIVVSWPENILPTIIARSLMEGVRAALELSGAKDPSIEMFGLAATGARYALRWG